MQSQMADPEGPSDAAHVAAVLALVFAAEPCCGTTVVVAIDGPSGAGKSSLGHAVAAAWGAPLIAMDTLYPGWQGLSAGPELLATTILQPLARHEPAAYRAWDWERDAWHRGRRSLPWTDRLVVEGCGSAVRPAGEYAAVRVWLDADPSERRRRGIERDGAAYAGRWDEWAAQEAAIFAADHTRDRAHLKLLTDVV